MPAKAGIQYLLILLVPGLRREDNEVTHYLFLDIPYSALWGI